MKVKTFQSHSINQLEKAMQEWLDEGHTPVLTNFAAAEHKGYTVCTVIVFYT